jgi:hypothetical protein
MIIKQLVKKTFKKLGYTLLKGDLIAEVREMEAPSLEMSHMPNCKVFPNRQSVLKTLPKNGIIAEVGVAYGDFSEILIDELNPKLFFAIDLFSIIKKEDEPWGKSELAQKQQTHEEYYTSRFQSKDSVVKLKKGYSWDKLAEFEDAYFDYVYLDAGHTYPDVAKDVEILASKIKVGGYIQFNDYATIAPTWLIPFGVARAVNELLLKGDYQMVAFCLQNGGYHDVLVQKIR